MALALALPEAGWALLNRESPRVYQDRAGCRFPTFERDGVRLAFSIHRYLAVRRGAVWVYEGDAGEAIVRALLVDPGQRRQGKARAAMLELGSIADRLGLTLYIEPAPLEKDSLSRDDLVRFYKGCSYRAPRGDSELVLVRHPAVPPTDFTSLS